MDKGACVGPASGRLGREEQVASGNSGLWGPQRRGGWYGLIENIKGAVGYFEPPLFCSFLAPKSGIKVGSIRSRPVNPGKISC